MNRKKMLTIGAVAVVSASILITGTFAWFASQSNTLNKFSSNKSGAAGTSGLDVVENFDKESAKEFEPGVTVKKEVKVTHSGAGKFVARVRLEQFLQAYEPNEAGNGLKEEYNADATLTADATTGVGYYPVEITKDAHDKALEAGGYSDANVVPGTPEGVTVYKKAMPTYVNGSISVAYEYIGYKTITTGEGEAAVTSYQPIKFDVEAPETDAKVAQADLDAITAKPGTPEYNDALVKLYETANGLPTVSNITYGYNIRQASTEKIQTTFTSNSDTDSDITNKIALQIGVVKPIAEWNGPEDAWFYDTDGWCYYGKVFENGLTSPNLLNSVTMKPSVQSEMDGVDYKINVRLQSVQPTAEAITAEWTKAITATNEDGAWEMTGATTISDAAKTMLGKLAQQDFSNVSADEPEGNAVADTTTAAADTTTAAADTTTAAADTTTAAADTTTAAADTTTAAQ